MNYRLTDNSQLNLFGGLAQLARAPALHAGGQRFESVILHIAPLLSQEELDNELLRSSGTTFFDILEEVIEREDNSRDVVGLEITSESCEFNTYNL